MSGLFDRLGSAFLAPPDSIARTAGESEAVRSRVAEVRDAASPSVVVLCRPEVARSIGGAVALALAASAGAPRALLSIWPPDDPPPLPALARAPARRLAATLSDRGHDATATGRLAVVRLAADLAHAAPEAVRARAAAGADPSVVALAGPRDQTADELLRSSDAVLVADGDETVLDLALAGLSSFGVLSAPLNVPEPTPAVARALAAGGQALLPPLRGAVTAALAETPLLYTCAATAQIA